MNISIQVQLKKETYEIKPIYPSWIFNIFFLILFIFFTCGVGSY